MSEVKTDEQSEKRTQLVEIKINMDPLNHKQENINSMSQFHYSIPYWQKQLNEIKTELEQTNLKPERLRVLKEKEKEATETLTHIINNAQKYIKEAKGNLKELKLYFPNQDRLVLETVAVIEEQEKYLEEQKINILETELARGEREEAKLTKEFVALTNQLKALVGNAMGIVDVLNNNPQKYTETKEFKQKYLPHNDQKVIKYNPELLSDKDVEMKVSKFYYQKTKLDKIRLENKDIKDKIKEIKQDRKELDNENQARLDAEEPIVKEEILKVKNETLLKKQENAIKFAIKNDLETRSQAGSEALSKEINIMKLNNQGANMHKDAQAKLELQMHKQI